MEPSSVNEHGRGLSALPSRRGAHPVSLACARAMHPTRCMHHCRGLEPTGAGSQGPSASLQLFLILSYHPSQTTSSWLSRQHAAGLMRPAHSGRLVAAAALPAEPPTHRSSFPAAGSAQPLWDTSPRGGGMWGRVYPGCMRQLRLDKPC